jgi:hypothetical protein
VRNPPRPVKQPRLGSFTSDSYLTKAVSYLKVRNIQNWPNLFWTLITAMKRLSRTPSTAITMRWRIAQWLLEPGAQAFFASAQQAGQCLLNMSFNMSSSVTSLPVSSPTFWGRWRQIQRYWLLLM